jgi:peptide/nickel transport system ATP-binding protein
MTAIESSSPLLKVRDLVVEFNTDQGVVRAVDGVSFELNAGDTLGLVGESGCGKTVTGLALLGLVPCPPGRIVSGSIEFMGRDLVTLHENDLRKIRGSEISMIFQEPMTALNPVRTVGKQLVEPLLIHTDIGIEAATRRAIEMLDRVGIPSPDIRFLEYPHQLSGGMRQRVIIAMALICEPDLLIADEPTTALDVTIQAQILELISDLQSDLGMSVILITHDLGVIAETSDNVVVMYAGRVAEKGSKYDIFDRPAHPYTRGLLDSIPRLTDQPKSRLATIEGAVPGLLDMPAGCRFENRCSFRQPGCASDIPPFTIVKAEHEVRCFEWERLPGVPGERA